MDNTYPPEAWQRLGKALESRRGQLGYGYRQRGKFLRDHGSTLSEKTLARIERGERIDYPDATVAAVESLYGYAPGSLETMLAGGEPTLSDGRDGTYGESHGLRAEILSPDEQAVLDAYRRAIRAGLERRAAEQQRNGRTA